MEAVFGILVFLFLVIAIPYGSYKAYEFYAPRYNAVENKVFHESQSYNDGMVRDLENLKMEYAKATEDGRMALRATILHRFSLYPLERLPADLLTFYESLEQQ